LVYGVSIFPGGGGYDSSGGGGNSCYYYSAPEFAQSDYGRKGQGYCVFNTLSYLEFRFHGPSGLMDANVLFNQFSSKYKNDIVYDSTGVVGVDNQGHILAFTQQFMYAKQVTGAEANSYLAQGKPVMAQIRLDPNSAVLHEVVLLSQIDGGYQYLDTTTN
jgi:hypothetical protein